MAIEEKDKKSAEDELSLLNSLFSHNNTLSVIMRCHREERISFLDEALFSLAIQYWQNLEVLIILQNGTKKFIFEVKKLLEKQPFQKSCKYQIHNVRVSPGFDGRSTLLNYGIKNATGRYLAFLDDDDVVYQHGYNVLIEQLSLGNSAIAVGGCRTARVKKDFGNWYIQTKEKPFTWGRNRFDLLKDNFIPIHSYVIDRARVDSCDLYFDDDLPPLEDYDFLLRLNSKYDFDFSKLDTFVCEYRLHENNSLPVYSQDSSTDLIDKYTKAFQLISERKKTIFFNISVSELSDLLSVKANAIPAAIIPIGDKTGELVDVKDSLAITENPQIIRKISESAVNKIYSFFSHYPHLEKQFSRIVRFGWRFLKKSNFSDKNNQE